MTLLRGKIVEGFATSVDGYDHSQRVFHHLNAQRCLPDNIAVGLDREWPISVDEQIALRPQVAYMSTPALPPREQVSR